MPVVPAGSCVKPEWLKPRGAKFAGTHNEVVEAECRWAIRRGKLAAQRSAASRVLLYLRANENAEDMDALEWDSWGRAVKHMEKKGFADVADPCDRLVYNYMREAIEINHREKRVRATWAQPPAATHLYPAPVHAAHREAEDAERDRLKAGNIAPYYVGNKLVVPTVGGITPEARVAAAVLLAPRATPAAPAGPSALRPKAQ